MTDQPKPFVHAEILAAWADDPKGVKISVYAGPADGWRGWQDRQFPRIPELLPALRYRATLRDGTVIESPKPEPKWEVRAAQLGDRRVEKGFGVERKTGAVIYGGAPDPEGTARMIAARWNGDVPDRSHIPEGYEYMPGAVLPKPLTPEEIRSRSRVWLVGASLVGSMVPRLAAEHPGALYYATEKEARQVYDAIRRRER